MRHVGLLALITAVSVYGCAEGVAIKSYPLGAKAFVDGQYIGTTPAEADIPRSAVGQPHSWRVEYRNCDSAEGQLQTRVAGGRIVAYIFTLGVVAIFKGPSYYPPVDAVLTGGDCEGPSRSRAPTGSGITIQQIVGDKNTASPNAADVEKTQRLSERLTTLRDLYNRKLLSEQEYQREKAKAVQEFSE